MTAQNTADIVAFPSERIVRRVEHQASVEGYEIPLDTFNPAGVEEYMINIIDTFQPNYEQQKFLDLYIELMSAVDTIILQRGIMRNDDPEVADDMQRSYYLMQQAVVAYICRYLDEYHVLQDVADHSVELHPEPGEQPTMNILGIVTDVGNDTIEAECVIFDSEEE